MDAWARGQKVVRLIGYDASPADTRRYTHASTITSDLFECRYPLREWGWDRAACIARIEAAQLPVPPKSSCFICGAMKPADRQSAGQGKSVSVRGDLGGRRN